MCKEDSAQGYGLVGLSQILTSYKGEVVSEDQLSAGKGAAASNVAAGRDTAQGSQNRPEVIRWSVQKLIETLENVRKNDKDFILHIENISERGDKYLANRNKLDALMKQNKMAGISAAKKAEDARTIHEQQQDLIKEKQTILHDARMWNVLDVQLMFPLAEAIRFAHWENEIRAHWGKELPAPKDLLFLGQWASNNNEVGIPSEKASPQIGKKAAARTSNEKVNQKKTASSTTTRNNKNLNFQAIKNTGKRDPTAK